MSRLTARLQRSFGFLVLGLALLGGIPFTAWAGPSCSGVSLIDQTLANGSRWQLCWEHHDNHGIIYSEIFYTPPGGSERMVLADVRLAQIFVPYDDNGARFHDVTDYGAGGSYMSELAPEDCPDGTLIRTQGKDRICQTVRGRGAAYHAHGHQLRGSLLELFSASEIGAYDYIPQLQFEDDGAIEIRMGATGALQRTYSDLSKLPHGWLIGSATRVGISHMHNYFFRLDFELGGTASDDVFERVDVVADGTANTRTKTISPFSVEGFDDVAPDVLRSWRVRDATLTNGNGHPISYELVPLESGHRDAGPPGEPFTHHDIYVTRYASDEFYASHNNRAELFPDAGENVTDFYDPPESLAGADVVVWYGISFHHIPRDEDESRMHAHWNGFRIEPRDWTDTHPLVTNQPPDLANPGNQSSGEGASESLQLQATDPEQVPLGYSAFGLPPGLSVDASSGLISGTLDPGTGSYAVEVRTDDGNSFDGESFLWDVGGNQPPVWTNPGPQGDAEGDAVSLQLSATNPDGPPPSYSASGLPPGLSVDSGSGLVSGTLGFDAAGVHPVTATASDEAHDVEQPFTWTVANTNRTPVWTDPGAQSHEEGEGVSVPLVASDPDGEDVDFSAAGLPPGLSIDSETGVVSGTLGYESAGEYSVTATATDGADPVDQPFTWTVANTNRTPVWTDPGAQSHEEGEGVSVPLVASDPDGEDVDFSAAGLPPGLSIDSETGVVSGTLGYESAGEYSVTATATDGADPADQPFTWSVADALPPSSVPVTSPLGLAVVLLAIGSVGVVALRRR